MFAIAMSICFKHLSSFWLGYVAMAMVMPPMPPLYFLALLPFASVGFLLGLGWLFQGVCL